VCSAVHDMSEERRREEQALARSWLGTTASCAVDREEWGNKWHARWVTRRVGAAATGR